MTASGRGGVRAPGAITAPPGDEAPPRPVRAIRRRVRRVARRRRRRASRLRLRVAGNRSRLARRGRVALSRVPRNHRRSRRLLAAAERGHRRGQKRQRDSGTAFHGAFFHPSRASLEHCKDHNQADADQQRRHDSPHRHVRSSSCFSMSTRRVTSSNALNPTSIITRPSSPKAAVPRSACNRACISTGIDANIKVCTMRKAPDKERVTERTSSGRFSLSPENARSRPPPDTDFADSSEVAPIRQRLFRRLLRHSRIAVDTQQHLLIC